MTDLTFEQKKSPQIYGLAYGLWFLTALLSVLVFMSGRAMIIRTYTRFFPWDAWRVSAGQGSLSLISILISLPLAMLVITIVIGGFEYQHRNLGKKEAWKMLARTLSLEAGFLLIALFL
jgi:hypothetical protein